MRGDRFCPLKVPDALPGAIMMPYRAPRWFRRSNCGDTKARWRPTHTNTYLQTQARTHSHMDSHIQTLFFKNRSPENQTNTCHSALFVVGLQQRLSELTFVHVKQGLDRSLLHLSLLKWTKEKRKPDWVNIHLTCLLLHTVGPSGATPSFVPESESM